MPRFFLAVPARIDRYASVQEAFTPLLRGRWVPDVQLHLTLAFLGERFPAEEITRRLSTLDLSFHPSEITALNYFPDSRIFFAGTDNDSLQALASRIAAALELPPQPFKPHVTLMRVKNVLDEQSFEHMCGQFQQLPLGTLLPEIVLYDSTLTAQGAHYRVVKRWPCDIDDETL